MTFLFGSHLSFRKKLKVIAKLAAEHASNLAAFACLYKVGGATCVDIIICFPKISHGPIFLLRLFLHQFMLASLKVLSRRIKQGGRNGMPIGILRQLSRSLISIIGMCMFHLICCQIIILDSNDMSFNVLLEITIHDENYLKYHT